MRFTSDDLGGLDLKIGHRALKYLTLWETRFRPDKPVSFPLWQFAEEIGHPFYPEIEAGLLRGKLIRKTRKRRKNPDYSHYYFLTERGAQIAKGNTLKRMRRVQLERLFADVQTRVAQVAQDNRFIYEFTFLAVWGSYMVEQSDYGDVDLAYWIEIKERYKDLPPRDRADIHFHYWPGDARIPNISTERIVWARPRSFVSSLSYERVDMSPFDDFMIMLDRLPDTPHRVLMGDIDETAAKWLAAEKSGALRMIDYG